MRTDSLVHTKISEQFTPLWVCIHPVPDVTDPTVVSRPELVLPLLFNSCALLTRTDLPLPLVGEDVVQVLVKRTSPESCPLFGVKPNAVAVAASIHGERDLRVHTQTS
jgi:hypothetical protein